VLLSGGIVRCVTRSLCNFVPPTIDARLVQSGEASIRVRAERVPHGLERRQVCSVLRVGSVPPHPANAPQLHDRLVQQPVGRRNEGGLAAGMVCGWQQRGVMVAMEYDTEGQRSRRQQETHKRNSLPDTPCLNPPCGRNAGHHLAKGRHAAPPEAGQPLLTKHLQGRRVDRWASKGP